jgi:hypothetical protein
MEVEISPVLNARGRAKCFKSENCSISVGQRSQHEGGDFAWKSHDLKRATNLLNTSYRYSFRRVTVDYYFTNYWVNKFEEVITMKTQVATITIYYCN